MVLFFSPNFWYAIVIVKTNHCLGNLIFGHQCCSKLFYLASIISIYDPNKISLPALRKPTSHETRLIVGCLVKNTILLGMKNHLYSFNNQIRRQRKGGAIGNTLTEKLAKLLMKRFDRKFKKLLKSLDIETELYKRFVDDITASLVA